MDAGTNAIRVPSGLRAARGLEHRQRRVTRGRVVDDGGRIPGRRLRRAPWRVNRLRVEPPQLRHEAADVRAVGIETLRLRDRIEDPEVRLRVASGRRGPLP